MEGKKEKKRKEKYEREKSFQTDFFHSNVPPTCLCNSPLVFGGMHSNNPSTLSLIGTRV